MYKLDYSDALLLYYLFFAKIIPLFVTFIFDRYLNIKIKFKSLSLFHANIENICVKLPGYEITVGEIGLKTKYFSSEYKKPLCIELEDVKINQSFDVDLNTKQRSISEVAGSEVRTKKDDDLSKRSKDFLVKQLNQLLHHLPPIAMLLVQFLGIRIKNFSTTVLNKERGPLASLSVPSLDLTFDGLVVKNNRTLFIALKLQHIRSKFFAFNKQNPSRKPHQPCLAEIVLDFSLEARVAWCEKKLLYEKLNVSIESTQVFFNGGLFDIIEHFMLHLKLHKSSNMSIEPAEIADPLAEPIKPIMSRAHLDVEKIIEKLTPDLMIIQLENTEVKSFNKQNSYHYHVLLQHFELKGRLKTSSSTTRTKVSNLRIYTPSQEVLHLKEILIETKSIENLLVITKIDTLHMVYNHEDIYGWFLKIFTAGMKSNRKEMIVKAFRTANEKMVELYHSEFTQEIFKRFVLNTKLEIRNTKLVLELSDEVSSSINISKVNFELHQSEELRRVRYDDYSMNLFLQKRHWKTELSTAGPFCWYMNQKFDYLKDDSKKTYVRGSAVFLGSSQVNLKSEEEYLRLKLRVNTLRTEYSQKLTSFTVKSISSFKEYIDLFSQLKSKSEVEVTSIEGKPLSIEKVLNGIKLDARVADISMFFINRHDVCAFVNLKEFISVDIFNYSLETLQVSTVDFSKYDSLYDLTDFSSVYVSTKSLNISLQISNNLPQIGVDFTDKLDCSWNAHFLRHLLSLARDINGFRRNLKTAMGKTNEQSSLIPHSLPVGLDIKKLRNIRIKHADVNVDKLILLINELSGENLFFYHYFN